MPEDRNRINEMAKEAKQQESEEETLSLLERHFNAAEESTTSARASSEKCRDYYDNKQWTKQEEAKLKQRRQPVITNNMVKDKVEWLLGMERKARTDPKAFPRNPQDEDSAEAATDALRYIADDNDFDQVKSLVAEDFFIEGSGFSEVIVKKNVENAVKEAIGRPTKVLIRHIRWDRMYYDPHSLRHDFSDAEYMGQAVWMDAKKAKIKWPKHEDVFDGNMREAGTAMSETYADKPISRWVDPQRQRVRILEEYYKRDGKVFRCVFTKGVLLEGPKETVYRDDEGEQCWPYEGISAYVDREGNRYGVVKRYLDQQDEVNHRRSKSLHLLSVRQVIAEKGAVDDVEDARSQVAKADGYIEVNPDKRFEISHTRDLAQGQLELLNDAMRTLSTQGPNDALVQGGVPSESGRSRMIRQESSTIQLGPLFDRLRGYQRRVFRKAWGCVRLFWQEEAWIRVTDDERKLRFVPLNQPITEASQAAEQLAELQEYQPQNEKEAAELQAAIQQLQLIAQDPRAQQNVVGTRNNVAELDMDIVLDESADIINLQGEQYAELVGLAQSGMVQIAPEVILEASSLRNKDRLIEMQRSSSQSQGKIQEAFQQLELQKKEFENLKTQAQADREAARADRDRAEAALRRVEAALATGQLGQPTLKTEHVV